MENKNNGILLHISSLYNKYGIGSFGKCAYEFVDYLYENNQKFWQILPLGHTGYGDSPYQTYSIFAGNPYFIDLDILIEEGLLLENEIDYINDKFVDYGSLYNSRYNILRKAYSRFDVNNKEYIQFIVDNNWVLDYSIFMTIKELNNFKSLENWKDKYRYDDKKIINELFEKEKAKVNFWIFIQYKFHKQWLKLKEYANKKGIKIIGDIPIYVPYDSVEVWAEPENFLLDESLNMLYVSGAPRDNMSKDGQIWGSPLYNYEYMKKNNYSWWVERIKRNLKMYDYLRIDHFIGFDKFYMIDSKTRNVDDGKWGKGPGMELFNEVKKHVNGDFIIAEDLGNVTESVKKLVNDTGFYSMKVLQFDLNGDVNNPHNPINYYEKCICYTGTHDNPTLKEWLETLDFNRIRYIRNIVNEEDNDRIIDKLINILLDSKAGIIIIPMQDYLHLGSEGRMNKPGTSENNWVWRLKNDSLYRKISFK